MRGYAAAAAGAAGKPYGATGWTGQEDWKPQWHTSSSSTARSRAEAASFGPLHFTGYASVNFQVRTALPAASMRVMAPLRRWILLPAPANPSPELLVNHSKRLSVSVTPRLRTRFGHFIRPVSLCVYWFWPPSASSSTSICTDSPLTSVNAPIVRPSTVKTNFPAKGGSTVRELATNDSLPRTLVQAGDLFEEPDPVAVFEIQQGVEAPVQVVREVGDLLPDLVDGVAS